MNRLLRSIDDAAEGAQHPFERERGDSFQGVQGRIDIFIVSQVPQTLANKEVPGEKPPLVWFVKTDMVIGMPGGGDHQKTEF